MLHCCSHIVRSSSIPRAGGQLCSGWEVEELIMTYPGVSNDPGPANIPIFHLLWSQGYSQAGTGTDEGRERRRHASIRKHTNLMGLQIFRLFRLWQSFLKSQRGKLLNFNKKNIRIKGWTSNRPIFMFWFKHCTPLDCSKVALDNDDAEDEMDRDEGYCNPLGPWIITLWWG